MRDTIEKSTCGAKTLGFQDGGGEARTVSLPGYRMRSIEFRQIVRGFWTSRYGRARLRLMDINCLVYLGTTGFLLLFFHASIACWPMRTLTHAAICLGILEIVRLNTNHPGHRTLEALRTFYPVPVFLYAWEELGTLVTMFYGSYWFTETLVRSDKLLFGVHPTVWMQQFYRPWLNELMNFFYIGYYTLFVVVPLSLFASRRKKQAALTVLSIATFVYFSNFFLFLLLPACSPPFIPLLRELHTNQQTGFFFVAIHRIVQANGGIPGGCFPSSHVAGAFAWALCALRYNKKLGLALIPIAVGVGFATVYNGVHHAVDPLIGSLWGGITFSIALKLVRKRGEDPLASTGMHEEASRFKPACRVKMVMLKSPVKPL